MEETTNEATTDSPKSSGFNPVMIIVILAALGIAGWMFYNQSQTKTESTSNELATPGPTAVVTEATPTTAVMEVDGVKVIEIEGGSFYFKPNEIRVKVGDKVKVTLKAVDMMHDFVIDELDVKTEVTKSGSTSSVEFTADTAGTFEFYCSVGEHRLRGMVGKLIVE